MRLSMACYLLSMGHLFWRPQLLEDGLNRRDVLNQYRFIVSAADNDGLYGVQVPRGIGKLKALHTLGVVSIVRGKGEATLKDLQELTQLRKLGVAGINNENINRFWSAIAGHSQLQSLSLHACTERDDLDGCLGGELLPPKCLESLKMYGKLVRVPRWIHQLPNLSRLELGHTHLHEEDIQALGMLPNLVALSLRRESIQGDQLHFLGSSFPRLVVLELSVLTNVVSVRFGEGAMPKLELARAAWCKWIEEISGLTFLSSLREINLRDVYSSTVTEEVQRQLMEHANHVSLKLM